MDAMHIGHALGQALPTSHVAVTDKKIAELKTTSEESIADLQVSLTTTDQSLTKTTNDLAKTNSDLADMEKSLKEDTVTKIVASEVKIRRFFLLDYYMLDSLSRRRTCCCGWHAFL